MSYSNIPDKEHWAIITETSTYVEGDERSRTNPGHGYPAYIISGIEYEVFHTKKSLEASLSSRGGSAKVMHVQPLIIETTVTTRFKE